MYSHNWTNGDLEESLSAYALASCIESRHQKRLFKRLSHINNTINNKCDFIKEGMLRFEGEDYQDCGFCSKKWVWQHFKEAINISVKFNNGTNASNINNTLIPKLIEVCKMVHTQIKSAEYHNVIDRNFTPKFKSVFGKLSRKFMPITFNFEDTYENALTMEQPRATPCYVIEVFFKEYLGFTLPCKEFFIVIFLSSFLVPLLVGIILYCCKGWMNYCCKDCCKGCMNSCLEKSCECCIGCGCMNCCCKDCMNSCLEKARSRKQRADGEIARNRWREIPTSNQHFEKCSLSLGRNKIHKIDMATQYE